MADPEHGQNKETSIQSNRHSSTDYFTIRNAKVLCFFLIVFFTLYHGLLKWKEGMGSCSRLFLEGRYENTYEWQPTGCMVHIYNHEDVRFCLEKRNFFKRSNKMLFMGDTQVEKLQNTMSQMFTNGGLQKGEDVHLNMTFQNLSSSNLHLDTRLPELLTNPPGLVVIKGTMDLEAPDAEQAASYFRIRVNRIAESMKTLTSKGTQVIWLLQNKSHDSTQRDFEEAYNGVVQQLLANTGVKIWSSRSEINRLRPNVKDVSDITQAETLLNLYCNNYIETKDGSCCKEPEDVSIVQITFFAAMALCVITYLMMSYIRSKTWLVKDPEGQTNASVAQKQQLYQLTRSLCSLAIILFYFFLCDRANFYMKENKHYSPIIFFVPLTVIVFLGFAFTAQSKFTTVLHRHQTDEWKGWMQLVILLYHMTGASQVIPIYMHVRLLVTSYLFLTGYGHFCFFWSKGDPSFVRFCQVMFRMNFLTILLCLSMNRTYQFYYFVPLVSFWYLVVYLILVIPPHVTAVSTKANPRYHVYLILKFATAFLIISLLYYFKGAFDQIFGFTPWKMMFASEDGSMHEWRFRWELDRYSVLIGMVFAFIYMISLRTSSIDDSTPSNLLRLPLSILTTCLCVAVFAGFTTFVMSCANKPECNHVNEYIGFLPIISFIFLRNMWGHWRCRFSRFFAWFGRISLELFIGQYHIWLAQDTYGFLVLVPGYPLINIIVTTFIFIFVAHEIHLITGVVVPLAVPKELCKLTRNIVIFIAVFIPIGILRSIA